MMTAETNPTNANAWLEMDLKMQSGFVYNDQKTVNKKKGNSSR